MTRTFGAPAGISLVLIATTAATGAAPCQAAEIVVAYDMPSQDLGGALKIVAKRSGRDIIFPAAAVAGRRSSPLKGRYTVERAVALLLEGSGLVADFSDGAVLIHDARSGTASSPPPVPLDASISDAAQQIVVTGTQIRGASPVGSKLLSIGRADIERSGFTSTQQIVQSLPQNYGGGPNEGTTGATIANGANFNTSFGSGVNLRGLGPASTLVLLDSNRIAQGGTGGVFGDLSMIPASAIERIEVLTDGASSLYGSDAVAGVVNIIPRKDFVGAETSLTQSSADGAANEFQFSQLLGAKWNGGHAMIAYEYDRRGRLAADDTDFYTEDLRRFGGPDYRTGYGNPGTIIAANGQTFAIPAGQDGRNLKASDLKAGTQNLSDDLAGTDLIPRQWHHSAYGAASQTVAPGFSVYAEGLFTDRHYDRRTSQSFEMPFEVDPGSPFYVDPIGTNQPIEVEYRLSDDLGQERLAGTAKAWSGIFGGKLDLGRWSIDAHGTFGRQTENFRQENLPNFFRLFAAIADTDPATAFDLLGSGSGNTDPATVAAVRGIETTHSDYTVWAGSVKADGPVFDLPAGALRAAVGGEYRTERFASSGFDDAFSDPGRALVEPTEDRRILAGFAEIDAPLVSPDMAFPMVRKLTLAASVRVENYDDFGTTTNPKIGATWEPVDGVSIRANWGTSFRAPSFNDVRQDIQIQEYFTNRLPDPQSPTGTTTALILVGNKPGIGPERAHTLTAGFDIAPKTLPGLALSATWFAIDYKDRIQDARAQTQNVFRDRAAFAGLINENPTPAEIAFYYASPAFENDRGIPASAIQATVDVRNQNLAVSKESGVDFQASYGFAFAGGKADTGIDGSYLFYLKQAVTKSAPFVSILGTIDNPARFRMRGHVGWTKGSFTGTAFLNHVSGYLNILPAVPEHVSSWTTVDATIGCDIRKAGAGKPGLRLSLNATNLFDRDPPYVNNDEGVIGFGYDPSAASPFGRVVSASATVTW